MIKRNSILILTLLLSFFLIFGGSQTFAAKKAKKVLYLKNNIHAQARPERGGKTVNRGSYANYVDPGEGHFFFPVNTPVEIKTKGSFRGKMLVITSQKDGKIIYLECNEKNMGMGMKEYIDVIASPQKVSLKGLSKLDSKGIRNGKAYKGMTKKGVRMALGYPAKHKTPSLKSNTWTYWRDRFRMRLVTFNSKGRVIRIQ